jgi:hypothetical protein
MNSIWVNGTFEDLAGQMFYAQPEVKAVQQHSDKAWVLDLDEMLNNEELDQRDDQS